MRIGFLPNFEVCDTNGEESQADIFVVENNEGTIRHVYAFLPDSPDPHPGEFEDYEQDAWMEEITLKALDAAELPVENRNSLDEAFKSAQDTFPA